MDIRASVGEGAEHHSIPIEPAKYACHLSCWCKDTVQSRGATCIVLYHETTRQSL